MEENALKNKVIIIGHIDAGNTRLSTAINLMKEKGIELIPVESMSELKHVVGNETTENISCLILNSETPDMSIPEWAKEPMIHIITKLPDPDPEPLEGYWTERDLRKQNKKKSWQSPYKFHR